MREPVKASATARGRNARSIARRLLIGVSVVGLLGLGPAPAPAIERQWNGVGAVAGTLAYEKLAGVLNACGATPFEVAFEDPAFALQTPDGPRVVPLTVRGSGLSKCESEAGGWAAFRIELRAGELRCDLPAGYTRIGGWMQLVAGAPSCEYGDGGTAPGYSWLFELAYTNGRVVGTASYTL